MAHSCQISMKRRLQYTRLDHVTISKSSLITWNCIKVALVESTNHPCKKCIDCKHKTEVNEKVHTDWEVYGLDKKIPFWLASSHGGSAKEHCVATYTVIVVFLLSAAWWPLPTATLTCAMLAAPAHGADILPACTLGSKNFPRTVPKAFNIQRSLGLQQKKYLTAISS